MNLNIVIGSLLIAGIYGLGFVSGSGYESYKQSKEQQKAIAQLMKQEQVKRDAKDKELAEANKRITELKSLNERVQCSPNKPSKTLQSCEQERIRLRELTKRCSSALTRYIEGTDKLLIEYK